MNPTPTTNQTVILGAGIVGLSTAFYLAHLSPHNSNTTIHLVDPTSRLFHCASGLAGFLASNCTSPPPSLHLPSVFQEKTCPD
jgi:glycine/D-amino acid oxidase-like deaminating enzyme